MKVYSLRVTVESSVSRLMSVPCAQHSSDIALVQSRVRVWFYFWFVWTLCFALIRSNWIVPIGRHRPWMVQGCVSLCMSLVLNWVRFCAEKRATTARQRVSVYRFNFTTIVVPSFRGKEDSTLAALELSVIRSEDGWMDWVIFYSVFGPVWPAKWSRNLFVGLLLLADSKSNSTVHTHTLSHFIWRIFRSCFNCAEVVYNLTVYFCLCDPFLKGRERERESAIVIVNEFLLRFQVIAKFPTFRTAAARFSSIWPSLILAVCCPL